MARKKQIEDDVLLDLIKKYYNDVCHGNGTLLRLPHIAQYVSDNGFEGYSVTTLRRNATARSYIASLQGDIKKASDSITTYTTLDVDAFIDNNQSRDAMRRSLTELDTHYRNIAESAIAIKQENGRLVEDYDKMNSELAKIKQDNDELKRKCAEQKTELAELRQKNKSMKRFIEDNIYPEMANELLKEDGELKGTVSTHIDTEKTDTRIIRSDTSIDTSDDSTSPSQSEDEVASSSSKIESNVVKGLFDKFE